MSDYSRYHFPRKGSLFSAAGMLSVFMVFNVGCDGFDQDNPDPENAPSAETEISHQGDLHHSRSNAITTAVERTSGAVVGIKTTQQLEQHGSLEFDLFEGFFYQPGEPKEYTTIGSGFIISEDGYVLTNEHISTHGADEVVVSMHDGQLHSAQLIDADVQTDIALLKIDADTSFSYLEFADSDSIRIGEWAIAIGNPTGMYEDGKPTVSVGVISASNRSLRQDPRSNRYYLDMIQTDATINPANAGGPLVDATGKVLGINTLVQTAQRSQMQPGLGFAIPSNRIKPLVNAFKKGGQLVHDFDPGFESVPVTHEIAEHYNLEVDHGLLVLSVNKDGPAYECGILPGDVLLRVDNQRLLGNAHTTAIFNQYSHGDSISLDVMRDGESFNTNMLLRKRASIPTP